MTKTCGECNSWNEYTNACVFHEIDMDKTNSACADFEAITNGDKIIKQGNKGIAAFACGLLNDRSEETFQRVLSLLNAPAESEGKDE